MKLPEPLDQIPNGVLAMRVFGEPIHVEGAVVIPVAKIRGRTSTPVGVYVIRDGDVTWNPAVDGNRIALIGVITGLLSAVIATLAMLRRPPWPDVHIFRDLPPGSRW